MVDIVQAAETDSKPEVSETQEGTKVAPQTFTGIDIVQKGLPDVDIDITTDADDVLIQIDITDPTTRLVVPKVYSKKTRYLELIDPVIKIPTLKGVFKTRDHFKVNTRKKAEVPISCIWKEFAEEFLDQDFEPRPGYMISASRIVNTPNYPEIIDGIGPDYEIDLVGLYQLMHRHARRGDVPFSGISQPNVFFMKNRFGKSRSVRIAWLNDGWIISSAVISPGWHYSFGNVFHFNPLFRRH